MWGLRSGWADPGRSVALENAGVIVAREETGTPRIEGLGVEWGFKAQWNGKPG